MSEANDLDVETWSGKDRHDENFPVGSILIARRYRDPIHRFYRFARNADDIADSPMLAPEDKLARLNIHGGRAAGAPGDWIAQRAGVARQSGQDGAFDAACDRPADRVPPGCDQVALCDDRRTIPLLPLFGSAGGTLRAGFAW
jgi:hypothetical protein